MRVFWPKTGVAREHGIAVGWRLDDTLCVVAVVEDGTVKTVSSLDPLVPLARVSHAASYQEDAEGLMIFTHEYLPVASSHPVEVVLYTPSTSPLAQLALGNQPSGGSEALGIQAGYGPHAVGTVDLERVLRLLNAAGHVQAELEDRPVEGRSAWLLGVAGKLAVLSVVTRIAVVVVPLDKWGVRGVHPLILSSLAKAFFTLLPFLSLLHLALYAVASQGWMKSTLHSLAERPVSNLPSILLRHACQRGHQLAALFDGVDARPADTRSLLGVLEVGYLISTDQTDWLLGITAAYLVQSCPKTLSGLPSIAILADPVIAALGWLNAWPVGLKLNTPLSEFMSSAFTSALVSWRDTAVPLTTGLAKPTATLLCVLSCAGLTFPVALIADLVQLATLHLRLCHALTAMLSRWLLVALKRLWDLFRGKRWNVLRNRTDSHAYDVDTLFLGTLLFTLTAFLTPTVLAYAALFASVGTGFTPLTQINAAIAITQRVFSLFVAGLNSTPVFELSERIVRPQNVPAGIVFSPIPPPHHFPFILDLQSTPRSIGTILSSWLKSL